MGYNYEDDEVAMEADEIEREQLRSRVKELEEEREVE